MIKLKYPYNAEQYTKGHSEQQAIEDKIRASGQKVQYLTNDRKQEGRNKQNIIEENFPELEDVCFQFERTQWLKKD